MKIRPMALRGLAVALVLATVSSAGPLDPDDMISGRVSKEAWDFLNTCRAEYKQKQEALQDGWLADYETYDADFERGVLTLNRKDKPPILFDVEVIGSSNSTSKDWEWAWNNPNVEKSVAVPRRPMNAMADKYDLEYLR